ncbi:glutamate-5-semialdehyde dehydrogenase [Poseidonibacter ostreae]|jgi:glutamate-5-semialdehyde dehydrogenase|uniref:Gamma-glutamyl phosphate reductase n=1 Tax=Poseidonibacter ostreae TaxID=2654171 RepID=A0A6L4WUS2_9BACT|nr:glutamate-5-semialdehyde dehydrogenase [Poseidonibacter ostreae]KAB7884390.1 glutamate-5-semialdehyde dehydrogenase [Poseidonibacter ostreae]KAB7889301.1 glutamate-5-semialdehyde dehydrogenase [Poseidonibacter ostreae]KAB7892146.1 glutamate-5-semialdehyde dehydrogenase [Poseidonibacter ostreae]MAC83871.1 glutamate-5-semialdehyde dehydrogenase [Arcobacter sp.]
MQKFLEEAKKTSRTIANLDTHKKNRVLREMADALIANSDFILEHNNKDMSEGTLNNLSSALLDRLLLTQQRIEDMALAIKQIAEQKEPVGKTLEGWITEDGLNIQKISVPIGVIGIIYESRPNVTSDTAALCFKSGNVCVLKGGKEAEHSNKAIAKVLKEVLAKNKLPQQAISLLPDSTREGVANLIKQDKYVDLIVPRGGEALIRYVSENSSVPVIKHDKGLCHIFVDKDAAHNRIIDIAINAKCQRPGVCNSMETLLIHEEIAAYILPGLYDAFMEEETVLKGCEETAKYIDVQIATEDDYNTEYLANILNIKVVKNVDEAIEHIAIYGSGHSESILSENYTVVNKFLDHVDAACVYANASTRFTDGGAFGLGAEVGISTNKLHSRGPMGISDLTTFKYKIYGKGQIR